MTRHLALVGPTASGKSSLALVLARELGDVELVSVDSMQVYRGMDIGTAKPTVVEQAEVRHHCIDLVDHTSEFSLAEFQRAVRAAVDDVEARGRRALLVGGTGLYLQAVVDELELPGRFPDARAQVEAEPDTRELHRRLQLLDPRAADRMEPDNRRRVVRALEVCIGSGRPFSSFGPGIDAYPASRYVLLGIWVPRHVGARRVDERVDAMVAAGWVEEVRRLRDAGGLSPTAAQALGYPEIAAHLDGRPLDEAVEEVKRRTRAFARRQRAWFRRDPRIAWHGTASDPERLLPGLLRDCTGAVEDRGGDRRS